MNLRALTIFLVILVVGLLLWQSIYIVNETEQVLVTRLGKPIVGDSLRSGWHWKLPILDRVTKYDKRLQLLEMLPLDLPTRDNKMIQVVVIAYWRIADPLALYQSAGDQATAKTRLTGYIESAVRDEVSRYQLAEIVRSSERKLIARQWKNIQSVVTAEERKVMEAKGLGAGATIHERILARVQQDLAAAQLGIGLVNIAFLRIQYKTTIE